MATKTISKSRVGFIDKNETIRATWNELIHPDEYFVSYKSTVLENGETPRKVRVTVTLTVEDVK
jgi:hypothetical protein